MSINSTNPMTLFGGTWEQIRDRFLLACGDNYSSGQTGGSATHSHIQGSTGKASGSTGTASGNTGSHTLTVDEIPSHKHLLCSNVGSTSGNDKSTGWTPNSDVVNVTTPKTGYDITATGGGKGHTHTLNNHTHSLNEHTHTNPNTNSASSMPPYVTVYMWKRTA